MDSTSSARRGARAFLTGTLLAVLLSAQTANAFDFDDVANLARRKARAAFEPPDRAQPAELEQLGYDRYRDIRFRPDRAIWRAEGLPFDLMFFHRAQSNPRVRMNAVVDGEARHLPYDSADFDFGKNTLSPENWGELDYAGLRVHYHLNGPEYKDELIVFLGASYFRALAAGTRYGLSARGLAVDTVGGEGEEFPYFPEFWIVKPAPDARTLRFFALLDSPRVSGAYQFDVTPGDETIVEVRSRLYLRAPIATLGVAPLTSMYQFGENQPHRVDFRPEVHDSDGLMVATGSGEWLWRPLINPSQVLPTSFSMSELKGFGLMQRDRNFASYEDPEARYDLRTSAWVEPVGSWGPGRVELVQIPTPNETNDNIVAFFRPHYTVPAGKPWHISYRLRWNNTPRITPSLGRATATRTGPTIDGKRRIFVIDFAGAGRNIEDLKLDVGASAGKLSHPTLQQNPLTKGVRASFELDPAGSSLVELRLRLLRANRPITETWLYRWTAS